MIKKSALAVLILTAGSLCALSMSAHAVEYPTQYNLMLKPADEPLSCNMGNHERLQELTLAGVAASKHHSFCREKYIKCIHNFGSRKAGPSTTQCGAWRDYCNAQGIWLGPHYLFKNKEKE